MTSATVALMPDPEPLDRELAAIHAASFGWALACCRRDRTKASDVLQESYAKVLDGRARWDRRAPFKTWFFGVVRLTALEQSRFSLRSWLGFGDAERDEIADDAPSPSSEMDRRMRALALSRALAQLAPRQREVLHLTFYEELTIREAAEIMAISIGSARQHYERGKARLEEILRRGGGP